MKTMNCREIQQLVAQQNAALLTQNLEASSHLHDCETCQQTYQDQQISIAMEQWGKVPESKGLKSRILANIQEQQIEKLNKSPRHWWAYSAIAASFLIFGLILQPMLMEPSLPASPNMTLVEVSVGRLETVNVMLNSEYSYQATQLTVDMHGGVSLDNEGKIQNVAWKSNLNKGKNILPLPVYLASPIGGEIHIKMKTREGFKEFVLQIKAKDEPLNRISI